MTYKNVESVFNDIYGLTNENTLVYLSFRCDNSEEVYDLSQEIYLEVYKTLVSKGVNYIKSPKTFIRIITKQKLYKYYNSEDKRVHKISFTEENENNIEYFLPKTELSLEEKYIIIEKIEEINNFLNKKPSVVRKVFKLFFSDDKKISEISEILNIKQSSVKNHIYRTLKELRNLKI